ncbi:MAG TPA: iron-containing alcohol dehydrogenase [Candidatus Scybalocola faecavium]|nr:iron-containing alcohol dehydrogenase [Candidatus Scybalocola faecavium]
MLKSFTWKHPTEIIFGAGCLEQLGEAVGRYGKRVLLVTTGNQGKTSWVYDKAKAILDREGITWQHFDQVKPNPVTEIVTAGAQMAKAMDAQVIIGIGGGSSMDTAKAIAVEASHPGTAWDYLHYKTQPTKSTLPVIAVSTTSGTGSQVTQCAVITHTATKDKSAIWNENIFPKIAIVDPQLMTSVPKHVTAATGFDAFAHNFEAYISTGSNAYVQALALRGMELIIHGLPQVLDDLENTDKRSFMAWADTLGGLAISSGGVTLPHGVGMQISGHCPQVSHGLSLSVMYPEFTRFTYTSAIPEFARVGRMFNHELYQVPDEEAARRCCDEIDGFIKKIGMWTTFKQLGVSDKDIRQIADCAHVLGDYKNNPKIAEIDQVYEMMVRRR